MEKASLGIVKSICLLSSSLTNLDNISPDNKLFSGKFKKEMHRFFDYFTHHTGGTVALMYQANPEDWQKYVYSCFEPIEECVDAQDEDVKQIALMISKMQVALKHLKSLERDGYSRIFVDPLVNRLGPLASRGYIKRLPISKEGLEKLVKAISEETELVIIK